MERERAEVGFVDGMVADALRVPRVALIIVGVAPRSEIDATAVSELLQVTSVVASSSIDAEPGGAR